jgi:hypothetical protein
MTHDVTVKNKACEGAQLNNILIAERKVTPLGSTQLLKYFPRELRKCYSEDISVNLVTHCTSLTYSVVKGFMGL